MTVKEMIKLLKKFPPDCEVLISDGFDCNFYKGDYDIQPWIDGDQKMCVDIGVGGCKDD